jgi:hypothetical protein
VLSVFFVLLGAKLATLLTVPTAGPTTNAAELRYTM